MLDKNNVEHQNKKAEIEKIPVQSIRGWDVATNIATNSISKNI